METGRGRGGLAVRDVDIVMCVSMWWEWVLRVFEFK